MALRFSTLEYFRTECGNGPWSNLRALGQSKVVSLTILVPFIGWLIIFNQQILDWLQVIPEIIAQTPADAGAAQGKIASTSFLSRLYLTYFGLLCLGAGSFLFQIFCPSEIRKYGDASEYVSNEIGYFTEPRAKLFLFDNAHAYSLRFNDAYNPDTFGRFRQAIRERSYPERIAAEYEHFAMSLWNEINGDRIQSAARNSDVENDDAPIKDSLQLKTASDELIVDNFIEIIAARRRVHRNIVWPVSAAAPNFKQETLSTRYSTLDYTKPLWRVTIQCFYVLGFVLLFIPSMKTIFTILHAAITK